MTISSFNNYLKREWRWIQKSRPIRFITHYSGIVASYLPRLSRRTWAMSIGSGALLSIIVINLYLHSDGYLRKQLRNHLTRVDAITATFARLSDIQPGQEIQNQSDYRTHLSQVTEECKTVISLASSRPKAQPEFATKLDASKRLCTDLIKITTYSGNLYRFLDPLIRTQTINLPDLGSDKLKANLRETKDTIDNTQAAIKTLDNSFVQDPAVPEVQTLLDELTKLDNAIVNPNDPVTVNNLYAKMKSDQFDFLTRRAYFWNNTVRLDQLHKALQKQIKSYK